MGNTTNKTNVSSSINKNEPEPPKVLCATKQEPPKNACSNDNLQDRENICEKKVVSDSSDCKKPAKEECKTKPEIKVCKKELDSPKNKCEKEPKEVKKMCKSKSEPVKKVTLNVCKKTTKPSKKVCGKPSGSAKVQKSESATCTGGKQSEESGKIYRSKLQECKMQPSEKNSCLKKAKSTSTKKADKRITKKTKTKRKLCQSERKNQKINGAAKKKTCAIESSSDKEKPPKKSVCSSKVTKKVKSDKKCGKSKKKESICQDNKPKKTICEQSQSKQDTKSKESVCQNKQDNKPKKTSCKKSQSKQDTKSKESVCQNKQDNKPKKTVCEKSQSKQDTKSKESICQNKQDNKPKKTICEKSQSKQDTKSKESVCQNKQDNKPKEPICNFCPIPRQDNKSKESTCKSDKQDNKVLKETSCKPSPPDCQDKQDKKFKEPICKLCPKPGGKIEAEKKCSTSQVVEKKEEKKQSSVCSKQPSTSNLLSAKTSSPNLLCSKSSAAKNQNTQEKKCENKQAKTSTSKNLLCTNTAEEDKNKCDKIGSEQKNTVSTTSLDALKKPNECGKSIRKCLGANEIMCGEKRSCFTSDPFEKATDLVTKATRKPTECNKKEEKACGKSNAPSAVTSKTRISGDDPGNKAADLVLKATRKPTECNKKEKPTECNKKEKQTECNKKEERKDCGKIEKPTECNKKEKPTECNKKEKQTECNKKEKQKVCNKKEEQKDCGKIDKPTDCNKKEEPSECNKKEKPTDCNKREEQKDCGKIEKPTECNKKEEKTKISGNLDPEGKAKILAKRALSKPEVCDKKETTCKQPEVQKKEVKCEQKQENKSEKERKCTLSSQTKKPSIDSVCGDKKGKGSEEKSASKSEICDKKEDQQKKLDNCESSKDCGKKLRSEFVKKESKSKSCDKTACGDKKESGVCAKKENKSDGKKDSKCALAEPKKICEKQEAPKVDKCEKKSTKSGEKPPSKCDKNQENEPKCPDLEKSIKCDKPAKPTTCEEKIAKIENLCKKKESKCSTQEIFAECTDEGVNIENSCKSEKNKVDKSNKCEKKSKECAEKPEKKENQSCMPKKKEKVCEEKEKPKQKEDTCNKKENKCAKPEKKGKCEKLVEELVSNNKKGTGEGGCPSTAAKPGTSTGCPNKNATDKKKCSSASSEIQNIPFPQMTLANKWDLFKAQDELKNNFQRSNIIETQNQSTIPQGLEICEEIAKTLKGKSIAENILEKLKKEIVPIKDETYRNSLEIEQSKNSNAIEYIQEHPNISKKDLGSSKAKPLSYNSKNRSYIYEVLKIRQMKRSTGIEDVHKQPNISLGKMNLENKTGGNKEEDRLQNTSKNTDTNLTTMVSNFTSSRNPKNLLKLDEHQQNIAAVNLGSQEQEKLSNNQLKVPSSEMLKDEEALNNQDNESGIKTELSELEESTNTLQTNTAQSSNIEETKNTSSVSDDQTYVNLKSGISSDLSKPRVFNLDDDGEIFICKVQKLAKDRSGKPMRTLKCKLVKDEFGRETFLCKEIKDEEDIDAKAEREKKETLISPTTNSKSLTDVRCSSRKSNDILTSREYLEFKPVRITREILQRDNEHMERLLERYKSFEVQNDETEQRIFRLYSITRKLLKHYYLLDKENSKTYFDYKDIVMKQHLKQRNDNKDTLENYT